MKIVGIISEFNPFHKGHEYIIKKAKEITGADIVIILMSGDFVQRGEPAIYDKYKRTQMALDGGADFVFELPIEYSTGSAGFFAQGAVLYLHKLGVKDIVFGSEIIDINILQEAANIYYNEPIEYKEKLQEGLKNGYSYPKARALALKEYDKKFKQLVDDNIQMSNATLGISYLEANIRLNLGINFYTIRRIGSDYNDTKNESDYPSALYLRNEIKKSEYKKEFLDIEDFDLLLKTKLISEDASSLGKYLDVDIELANSIEKYKFDFDTINQLIDNLKTKNRTYSKISRCLIHILLNIKKDDGNISEFEKDGYFKLLGMRNDKKTEFGTVAKNIKNNLIIKKSDVDKLSEIAKYMYEKNLYASNLYGIVFAKKYNKQFIHEYERKLLVK